MLKILHIWLHKKLKNYGHKKETPSVKSVSVRRTSVSGNMQKNIVKNNNGPPKVQRERMSQPTTKIEKKKQLKHMKEML